MRCPKRIVFPRQCRFPPPLPDDFLPPRTKDLTDTFREITPIEIETFLQKVAKNSSPGTDGIKYPMIQRVASKYPKLLPKVFNGLLRNGVFPNAWKHARWVPIPKPGRNDYSNPKNIRLISLLSCIGKLFEKCLTRRVAEAGTMTGAISPEHFGSRECLSAIDTLMVTLTKAQEWLSAKHTINKKSKGPDPPRQNTGGQRHQRSLQLRPPPPSSGNRDPLRPPAKPGANHPKLRHRKEHQRLNGGSH